MRSYWAKVDPITMAGGLIRRIGEKVAKMADWKQAALSIFCTTQKQNSQKTVSQ
jgi:hypothetical protein